MCSDSVADAEMVLDISDVELYEHMKDLMALTGCEDAISDPYGEPVSPKNQKTTGFPQGTPTSLQPTEPC